MEQSIRLNKRGWSNGVLRSLICISLVFLIYSSSTFAQSNQDTTGSGINIGRDNNGFVNTGEIKIILQSEAELANNARERQVLERLSEILSNLAERGEISVSETAVRALARDAIKQLANQPLTRNVIQRRQFTVPYQQTYNIAGTNNRITWIRDNCGANTGIEFRFNRDQHCWYGVGGTLEFSEGGANYELVFDGYDASGNAKFTIYPAN